MKLVKLLEGQDFSKLIDDDYKDIEKIKKDCQPFLKHQVQLFRGSQQYKSYLHKRPVRLTDRKPVMFRFHKQINAAFTELLGEPFRDSMLCLPSIDRTHVFGKSYAIFPIGEFKYCWSPDVLDLNHQFVIKDEEADADQIAQQLEEFITKKHYTTKFIRLNKQNEIMIRCKEVYTLPLSLFKLFEPELYNK